MSAATAATHPLPQQQLHLCSDTLLVIWTDAADGDRRSSLGQTALVSIPSAKGGSVELILNTKRSQTTNPDVWENFQVDPLSRRILVVKSTNHFYGGFAPIAVCLC